MDSNQLEVYSLADKNVLVLHRWGQESGVLGLMNFEQQPVTFESQFPPGSWQKLLDSSDQEWRGQGAVLPEQLLSGQTVTINPLSFTLYEG
jgi:maltooligosyltrehalose trehalohydrolase